MDLLTWLGTRAWQSKTKPFTPTGVYETDLSQLITSAFLPEDQYYGSVRVITGPATTKLVFGVRPVDSDGPATPGPDVAVAEISSVIMSNTRMRAWCNDIIKKLDGPIVEAKTLRQKIKTNRKLLGSIWLAGLGAVLHYKAFTSTLRDWTILTIIFDSAAVLTITVISAMAVLGAFDESP